MHSIKECDKQIEMAQNIAIITHVTPDADTLCAAVGLKEIIKQNYNNNKTINIFTSTEFTEDSIYFPVIKNEQINQKADIVYDLAISVDCLNTDRMGDNAQIFENATDTLNIDHHISNTRFANNNLIFKSSSTCEGLYFLFDRLGKTISNPVCKLFYAGIITDTNNLTSGEVSARTYNLIQNFLDRGIDLESVIQHFMKNNTLSKARLLERALYSLRIFNNSQLAIMRLTKSDFEKYDATIDDTLGIINHAIEIQGVNLAILLLEYEDDKKEVKLRSKADIDVSEIAQKFGGGGHKNMAGFFYTGSMLQLKDELLPLCKSSLEKYTNQANGNLFFDEDTN